MPAAEAKLKAPARGLVGRGEFAMYLAMAFFFTNMQGMVGGFRQAYLVDVLGLESAAVGNINAVCSVAGFVLSFFYAMLVDRAPKPGRDKFRPLVLMSAVPAGVFTVLMFYTPGWIRPEHVALMIAYQCVMTVLKDAANFFAGTMNQIAVVISPDHRERDKVLSFKAISSAIGNSAPLVVVLVAGLLKEPGILSGDAMVYFASAVLCALASTVTLLTGVRIVKERVAYSAERVNPLLGFRDILQNQYTWIVLLSETVKGLRNVAGYMGVFLAAALLGDASKFILFGLPTGIGTFVGMLVVNALLKRLDSRRIYILSGVYSIVANGGAFAVGAMSFRYPDKAAWQIAFFAFLFLIGLQFGASNLLPNLFKSDVLEDLEAKTHKRLEASLDFFVSIGTTASGALVGFLSPRILYGSSALNFIHYVQQAQGVYLPQSQSTKIRLLGVYTMVQGTFMLLGALPYLFYKLTGARKAQVHEEVLQYRDSIAAE